MERTARSPLGLRLRYVEDGKERVFGSFAVVFCNPACDAAEVSGLLGVSARSSAAVPVDAWLPAVQPATALSSGSGGRQHWRPAAALYPVWLYLLPVRSLSLLRCCGAGAARQLTDRDSSSNTVV